jgi:hypothetical protein
MFLFFGALITVSAAVVLYRVLVPRQPKPEDLGWMSQQWLVEHRASERA